MTSELSHGFDITVTCDATHIKAAAVMTMETRMGSLSSALSFQAYPYT